MRKTAALSAALSLLSLLAAAAAPSVTAAPPTKTKAAALDPKTLVLMGKREAFYDPNDLTKPPVLSAKSALLMDADTGQILWEMNARQKRAPASTTKILTALLLIENSNPEDIITVTDPKVKYIEPSSLHLKPWEKLSSRDMLYGLMLRSANDGAVVIAQHVAGSVPKFAERMNRRAHELGAYDTHFRNPNGLPDKNHYSTAYDLAVISRAALNEPRFRDAVAMPRRVIARSKNKKDTVVVTKGKKFFKKFPGADGIKTGYTRAAGHCFVGSATRGGRRLLSVVLGARNAAISDTIPLLSWGFQRFPAVPVARKGDVVGSVVVVGGKEGVVSVWAGDDLHASTDRFTTASVTPEVEAAPVSAPVRAGQEVGRLLAKVDGVPVGSVPLVAASAVDRSVLAAVIPARGSGWQRFFVWALIAVVGVQIGTTVAKGARRRRRRLKAARRGSYPVGASVRGRADSARPRHQRRSGHADH